MVPYSKALTVTVPYWLSQLSALSKGHEADQQRPGRGNGLFSRNVPHFDGGRLVHQFVRLVVIMPSPQSDSFHVSTLPIAGVLASEHCAPTLTEIGVRGLSEAIGMPCCPS
ncbi:hypothetical protein QC762_706010 [Podospora pseudocomata]|uniref:Uncharacterized protein n=1 Tax=Podospora pseudocomata TaxID=2093779 RepID=A0ABR0G3H3_9PEZI|nr:hypothetical protein QC762_706010 [Podospora pseudocomata]